MTFTTITYGVVGNTRVAYVRETDRAVLMKAMFAFTREMKRKGYSLDQIIFSYGEPRAVGTVRGIRSVDFPNIACLHETTTYAPGATNAHCARCGVGFV